MEKKRFRVGSIAVLFAVVILCVAVFAALTVVTSAQDLNMSRQYASHIQQLYSCEEQGWQWVAKAVAASRAGESLPDGSWEEDGSVCTLVETDTMRLTIRLLVTADSYEVQQWNCVTKWQPQNTWELWQ